VQRAEALEKVAEGALRVAQQELDEAEALLVKARQDVDRARTLARRKSGTEEELEAAEAAQAQMLARRNARDMNLRIRTLQITAAKLNTAILNSRSQDFEWERADYEQQIAAIEARLTSLRADLKRTQVRAPAAGKVLNLFEESQRVVAAGTPLLELGDLGRLEVEADFLSEDAAHMREKMEVEIFGRALGTRRVRGIVERIYPSAFRKISSLGVEQQRVRVIVSFDAAGTGLGDRFRVEVRVILDRRDDALLVPEGALFPKGGAWHVFRIEGGRAKLTRVRTGLRDGRVRELLEGLAENDRVVLHPGAELKDGATVEDLD
jgi:HlyD family secretion protein